MDSPRSPWSASVEPADVLHRDGVVQAVLRPDLLESRLVRVRSGHHPGGIAGDHADAREDDQGDQEEGDDGDRDPLSQEVEHESFLNDQAFP